MSQGHIFPKTQPTTICLVELTPDKNQAKTQGRSGLTTNAIFELSTLDNPSFRLFVQPIDCGPQQRLLSLWDNH